MKYYKVELELLPNSCAPDHMPGALDPDGELDLLYF